MPRARKYQALRDRHRLCRPASVRFFVVAVAAVPAAAARVIEKDRGFKLACFPCLAVARLWGCRCQQRTAAWRGSMLCLRYLASIGSVEDHCSLE